MIDSDDDDFDDFLVADDASSRTSASSIAVELQSDVSKLLNEASELYKSAEEDVDKSIGLLNQMKETVFFRDQSQGKELLSSVISDMEQFMEYDTVGAKTAKMMLFVMEFFQDSVEISQTVLPFVMHFLFNKFLLNKDGNLNISLGAKILSQGLILVYNLYPFWMKFLASYNDHLLKSRSITDDEAKSYWDETLKFNEAILSVIKLESSDLEDTICLICITVAERIALCFLPTDQNKSISLTGRKNNVVEEYGPNAFTIKFLRKKHAFLSKPRLENLGKDTLSDITQCFHEAVRTAKGKFAALTLKSLAKIFLYRPKSRQTILNALFSSLLLVPADPPKSNKKERMVSFCVKQNLRTSFLPLLKLDLLKFYHSKIAQLVNILLEKDDYTSRAVKGLGKAYKTEQEFDVVMKAAPELRVGVIAETMDLEANRIDELKRKASEIKNDQILKLSLAFNARLLERLSSMKTHKRLRFRHRLSGEQQSLIKILVHLIQIESATMADASTDSTLSFANLLENDSLCREHLYGDLDLLYGYLSLLQFAETPPVKKKIKSEETIQPPYLVLLEKVLAFYSEDENKKLLNKFFFRFLAALPLIPTSVTAFAFNIAYTKETEPGLATLCIVFLARLCEKRVDSTLFILDLLLLLCCNESLLVRKTAIKLIVNKIYMQNSSNVIENHIEEYSLKVAEIALINREALEAFDKQTLEKIGWKDEINPEAMEETQSEHGNETVAKTEVETEELAKLEISKAILEERIYLLLALSGANPWKMFTKMSELFLKFQKHESTSVEDVQTFCSFKPFTQLLEKICKDLGIRATFELLSELGEEVKPLIIQSVLYISSPSIITSMKKAGLLQTALQNFTLMEKSAIKSEEAKVIYPFIQWPPTERFLLYSALLPYSSSENVLSEVQDVLSFDVSPQKQTNAFEIKSEHWREIFSRVLSPLSSDFYNDDKNTPERLSSQKLLSNVLEAYPSPRAYSCVSALLNTKFKRGVRCFTKEILLNVSIEKMALIMQGKDEIKDDACLFSPLLFRFFLLSLTAFSSLKSSVSSQMSELIDLSNKLERDFFNTPNEVLLLGDFVKCCEMIKTPIYSSLLKLSKSNLKKVLDSSQQLRTSLSAFYKQSKHKDSLQKEMVEYMDSVGVQEELRKEEEKKKIKAEIEQKKVELEEASLALKAREEASQES